MCTPLKPSLAQQLNHRCCCSPLFAPVPPLALQVLHLLGIAALCVQCTIRSGQRTQPPPMCLPCMSCTISAEPSRSLVPHCSCLRPAVSHVRSCLIVARRSAAMVRTHSAPAINALSLVSTAHWPRRPAHSAHSLSDRRFGQIHALTRHAGMPLLQPHTHIEMHPANDKQTDSVALPLFELCKPLSFECALSCALCSVRVLDVVLVPVP